MGTRGFITFAVDGQEKTAYNHWDSYPSGKGVQVLAFLREAAKQPDVLGKAARALQVVDGKSKPTEEDIERLRRFADQAVSTGDLTEWYVLLRDTQGDPAKILEAGVIEDSSEFPLDSLFAEWGYVIDLDGDGWFEVYRGFQTKPHDKGRFAARDAEVKRQQERAASDPRYASHGTYYPCALAARFPLVNLPSEEEFLHVLERQEKAEDA